MPILRDFTLSIGSQDTSAICVEITTATTSNSITSNGGKNYEDKPMKTKVK